MRTEFIPDNGKKKCGNPKTGLVLMTLVLMFFGCTAENHTETMDSPKYTNHLINETSPYLLQHAHNPVEWYPWGEEALQKAKKENKLLLISVGYAACHWCHVMEHESFENEEVAQIMNAHFICIKVDREERPDIDQIYMNAVQLLTGSGGWPLNCIALPDSRPIYGGTYFKKTQWIDILQKLADEYRNNPDKVIDYAERLTAGIREIDLVEKNQDNSEFSKDTLDEMVINWQRDFDLIEGGANRSPKFPLPNNFQFLMRYAALNHQDSIDNYVALSLRKMAFGGLYDQIGGGFTRYSTDKYWKVPHFEKMLYDNGQLISLYSEAYTKYRDPNFKAIVNQTIEFCKRELYAGNGVFYSSLDADSEGEEGKFYVWTENEFCEVLGSDSNIMKAYYNIGKMGLWEHGNNILLRNKSNKEIAIENNLSVANLEVVVQRSNSKLLARRNKRIHPGLDDKSLTSWNALMLSGLVDAYVAFGEDSYLEEAKKVGRFITVTQRREDGGLNHNYKNGISNINGFLEDYSHSMEALLKLYQASSDEKWLHETKRLADYTIHNFFDSKSGMFYFTSILDSQLIARKMEITDNVIPSSNASMANALFLLGTIYDNESYLEISNTMLNNMKDQMPTYGSGYSHWGNLMLKKVYPFSEIAVVGSDNKNMMKRINEYYIPNKLILGSKNASKLPLLEGKYMEGESFFYVCYNKACQLPTKDLNQALKQIKF
ncbi:MAG: thioredoxin domain-containing protein [Salibacteraceae bacterium]